MMDEGIPEIGTSSGSLKEMMELIHTYLGEEVPNPGEQCQLVSGSMS